MPIGDQTFEADDIDYTISPDVAGGILTLDLHPLGGSFSIGAGVFVGGYSGNVFTESLTGTIEVGDSSYPVNDVGTLQGDAELKGPAPFASIGFTGSGFNFRLGVAKTGAPTASVSATGALATDPGFTTDLAKENERLQDDLDTFEFLPFLSFGYKIKLGG